MSTVQGTGFDLGYSVAWEPHWFCRIGAIVFGVATFVTGITALLGIFSPYKFIKFIEIGDFESVEESKEGGKKKIHAPNCMGWGARQLASTLPLWWAVFSGVRQVYQAAFAMHMLRAVGDMYTIIMDPGHPTNGPNKWKWFAFFVSGESCFVALFIVSITCECRPDSTITIV